ncbi:MAG: FHIPEP family type III secretion protein [Pirellulaceae bacterium]
MARSTSWSLLGLLHGALLPTRNQGTSWEMGPGRAFMMNYGRIRDLVFPLAIISSVLVILVPLPPALLDLMLAANITVSVIVLLTTIYVKTPLDFNVFPSLLLATTLARLVLNVATTRLILTQSTLDSMSAAGK